MLYTRVTLGTSRWKPNIRIYRVFHYKILHMSIVKKGKIIPQNIKSCHARIFCKNIKPRSMAKDRKDAPQDSKFGIVLVYTRRGLFSRNTRYFAEIQIFTLLKLIRIFKEKLNHSYIIIPLDKFTGNSIT